VTNDDPIDPLSDSVSDGSPVDWGSAESEAAGDLEHAHVRALRDLERIASFNRDLQRPASSPPASPGVAPGQWGHMTLLEQLSAGKNGEVWRAWDTWLQRDVALKFLLTTDESGTSDGALLDEARALAQVHHPGVVAVHGIDAREGRIGMWMELLTGPTLEAEIERRGPLPARDVAAIGVQLCRALDAVGSAGLVHRDIKPANIIREADGRTVLTDFGLGRRRAHIERETWKSSGTPVFMAPEVLAGAMATPRSDLYALGVTLRWALTGHCPFQARTIEDLRAEAERGPSLSLRRERPDTPGPLANAIARAMAPQAADRPAGAAELAEDLQRAVDQAKAAADRRARWRTAGYAGGVLTLLAAAAFLFSRPWDRPHSVPPARFSISAPPNTKLPPSAAMMAVSPDGRTVAFTAVDSAGTSWIWVRPLAALEATSLEGTKNGDMPFWSPDSRRLGFFAEGKLMKISIAGGPAEALCSAADPRGASWGRDGTIVFAPMAAGGLYRISSEGGPVTEILRPDSREAALRWPTFLPDGKHFLFVSLPSHEGGVFDIFAGSLGSNRREKVMTAGSAPVCAGEKGIIVASNNRLLFQRLDSRHLRPEGRPMALGLSPVSDLSVGLPPAAASWNGILAEPSESLSNTRLVWRDRRGRSMGGLPLPTGRYEQMHFSPEGRRLLIQRRDSRTSVDLWILGLPSGEMRRFTYGTQSRMGGRATWSPDGKRIAFNSNRTGRTSIYLRDVEGAGSEELLFRSEGQFAEVYSWSPDGKYLVFQQADPVTGWDIWLLPMDGKREPIPYLRTPFNEDAPSVSPDGRWLAYTSDATGRNEVFVRSFPVAGTETLVSPVPGKTDLWSKDGKQFLILHTVDHQNWSIPVRTTPTFRAEAPRLLFRDSPDALWLAPDPAGDRFIESIPAGKIEPVTITVDTNFLDRIGE